MDFTELNALIQELQDRSDIEITFELGDPLVDEDDYKTIEEHCNWNPRNLFHDIVNIHDGIDLIYKNEGKEIGEVNVMMLCGMFNEMFQEHYFAHHEIEEQNPSEEYLDFCKQYYPIDIYKESTSDQVFTVVKPISEDELEFWIWHGADPRFKLRFKTVEEYLKVGIKNKFIVNWQYFYIDTESMDFSDEFTRNWLASDFSGATISMDWALEQMKRHFPNADWSEQEQELKRVKEI
jgi:hypothetical protein